MPKERPTIVSFYVDRHEDTNAGARHLSLPIIVLHDSPLPQQRIHDFRRSHHDNPAAIGDVQFRQPVQIKCPRPTVW